MTINKQTIVYTKDANNVFYGEADIQTPRDTALWTIYKTEKSGSIVKKMYPCWDDGVPTDAQAFKWSEVDHYNYSLVPDTTAPTLTTVTIASNNSTPTLAKEWDVITITIVSSESLKAKPTFNIAGHSISAGSVTQGIDASHWTATYTMVSGDASGVIPFTINGTDLSGNAIAQVTTTTNQSSVTYDKTAPVFTSTSVVSDNTNTEIAKSGDTITVVFTSSETLTANPTVSFGGKAMTFGSKNVLSYTYTRTLDGSETEGTAHILVTGTDLAGNTTTTSDITTFTTDFTAPVFTGTDMTPVGTYKAGDSVYWKFTSSKPLASNPTATLGGYSVGFTSLVAGTYTYTIVIPAELAEGDYDLLVTGTSTTGNTTTDQGLNFYARIDNTKPTMVSANLTLTTNIVLKLSEESDGTSVQKENDWGFVVTETGNTEVTYAVSAINPFMGDEVRITVADVAASSAAGITITYVKGWNGTVADSAGNLMDTDATGVVIAPWA